MQSIKPIIVMAAAFTTLNACVSVQDTSEEGRERELEEYAESFGLDVDVSVSEVDGVESVTLENFGVTGTTIGNDLDLPAGFPDDVALHPEMAILTVSPVPGGYMLMGQVPAGVDAVAQFFAEEMNAQGWTPGEDAAATPAMRTLMFEKGQRIANLMLMPTNDATTVQISTMGVPQ